MSTIEDFVSNTIPRDIPLISVINEIGCYTKQDQLCY